MKHFGHTKTLPHQRHTDAAEHIEGDHILAEAAPIDGSHWQLCLHPLEYKRGLNPDLNRLLQSPGATNPFFDPAMLMASRDRITQHRIYQMVLWEQIGDAPVPRFSLPLVEGPGSFFHDRILKSFTHPFAPLGDPLLAPDGPTAEAESSTEEELFARLFELLETAFAKGLPPLVLDYVNCQSPLATFNGYEVTKPALSIRTIQAGQRASIISENGAAPPLLLSKKKLRELARLEKNLGRMGKVTFEKVDDPFDVLLRLEEYLLMEARGWKGRRGTSIHAIKRDAAFARQSVIDLAKMGRSEIFTLRLNDVAIASIILFSANGHYYPWKICFNESFSKFSPGTQLMVKLTRDITARPDFRYADSLAHFGRSWMTSLWPSQSHFQTMIIAEDTVTADRIVDRIEFAGKSKSLIKKILGRL